MIRKLGKVVFVLVTIFAFGKILGDEFADGEPIHYFAMQPSRLLWIVAFCAVGGLSAFLYSRLSSQRKWHVQLITLPLLASCCTVLNCYLLYETIWLLRQLRIPVSSLRISSEVVLSPIAFLVMFSVMLWLACYLLVRRKSAF